ncbi:MAG: hypothetical protein O2827_00205 [Verrucomicrobia bacterium]|nr:hypothetical protein [Verrucomicrobiota bacterium]
MKLLVAILLILLFAQSYFFYDLSKKKSALYKEYEDAVLAIDYHEKKNLEMIKQVQLAQNNKEAIQTTLTQQKIKYSELKATNDQFQYTINQLEQKNDSQAIIIEQKDNEILILKNELLKYLSE